MMAKYFIRQQISYHTCKPTNFALFGANFHQKWSSVIHQCCRMFIAYTICVLYKWKIRTRITACIWSNYETVASLCENTVAHIVTWCITHKTIFLLKDIMLQRRKIHTINYSLCKRNFCITKAELWIS